MPCLQSQKEQLEADIGKDVVGLFPTSSSKADELSDSDVPDLDYMDCFASISKVKTLIGSVDCLAISLCLLNIFG